VILLSRVENLGIANLSNNLTFILTGIIKRGYQLVGNFTFLIIANKYRRAVLRSKTAAVGFTQSGIVKAKKGFEQLFVGNFLIIILKLDRFRMSC